jgi:tetratricopeptide (TPR) repeat protein
MKHAKFYILFFWILASCGGKNAAPSEALVKEIQLKRGSLISCGPADKEFGTVDFDISNSKKVKKDFNLAIALLHSFEYEEAEKQFAKIIDEAPGSAMAYWGAAMCNYHQLWAPPTQDELKKGAALIAVAQSINDKTKRESDYINALSMFYKDWDKTDHRKRCIGYEQAMEKLFAAYPEDKEAAIFYALALRAAADPADKNFSNQKKAGAILTALYPNEPDHPGIAHYIIHIYDYPELAGLALPAARKYASVAPSSAHALHMPSHIFTRLGLWDEDIRSNLTSVSSATCYAEEAGIRGHWDEELHGMDYLVYAYLQKGDNDRAKAQWDHLNTIKDVYPVNFKVAYAFAAIPARYLLENRSWKEAASLELRPVNFPWNKFQWQEAIVHFARLMGAVHIDRRELANFEINELKQIQNELREEKDNYKANQVAIQVKAGEAWILFREGKTNAALAMMKIAADMEDKTEKDPVTPGEVIPARELLGDMLFQMNKPGEALKAYEANLQRHPNRYNALYGAGQASEKSGYPEKAGAYYKQLLKMVGTGNNSRPELIEIRQFMKNH